MNYSFYYKIGCYTKSGGGELLESLTWENMTFEVRTKWNWYFEYRAALLKIKNPKSHIEQFWGSREITDQSPTELKRYKIQARSVAVKRLVSRFKNAIVKYECEQRETLIPDFENERYLRTIEKLKEYEAELADLDRQLKNL